MIVYNITISIDSKKEEEFVIWMKESYIPVVIATGYFFDHRFLRLIHDPEEGEGINFAVQFYADSMKKMMDFENAYAEKVQGELEARFANQFVVFRSLLESVD